MTVYISLNRTVHPTSHTCDLRESQNHIMSLCHTYNCMLYVAILMLTGGRRYHAVGGAIAARLEAIYLPDEARVFIGAYRNFFDNLRNQHKHTWLVKGAYLHTSRKSKNKL